ncbi:MAG: SWIM zinc finger family protein [Pyrinomonadaceae bacterium]
MIELTSTDQLSKATARAKAGKLFVQPSNLFRQYHVTNRETGAQYTVDFFVRNGKRFGHCTCKAGINNRPCKHLSAAAGYHVMRAAAQHEAQRIALMPQAA